MVKRDHTFKVRDDLKLPDIENIWIESADLVILVIHKPPQFPNQDIFYINSKKSYIKFICLNGGA